MRPILLAAFSLLLCSATTMAQSTGADLCGNATPIAGVGAFRRVSGVMLDEVSSRDET